MRAPLQALTFALLAGSLSAAPISLDSYLSQVKAQNPGLKAQRAQDAAYALAAREPETAFSPQLKADLQRYDDQTEAALAAFSPLRTLSWGGDVSVSKLFGTGTYVSVGFDTDRSVIDMPATLGIPSADNQGAKYSLTLSQPLWRNFMASEVDAGLRQAQAGSDAQRAGNRYGAQAVLLQARQAYAQLATLHQVEAIQAESLSRNAKILEWTKQKFADNLADKVDVLQVEAALRQVALALSQTRDDEAKAALRFNFLRGAKPDEAIDGLEVLSPAAALPAPKGERQDLSAAKAALRASDALVDSVTQRFTPDISAFAQLGMNERDPDGGTAFSDVWKLNHPITVVGLKLTANLDWGLFKSVLKGAEQAQGAGAAQVEGKQQEIDQDWQQLRQAWSSVAERRALAAELEGLQKEKAEREKRRYQDGRTTNFQVLRFEDDYNLSRIQTLQLDALATALEATARFYNGDDQPW
jgi:outer membrane protein TolC